MESMEKLMHLLLLCGMLSMGVGIYGLSGSWLASIFLPLSTIALVLWYKIKYPS